MVFSASYLSPKVFSQARSAASCLAGVHVPFTMYSGPQTPVVVLAMKPVMTKSCGGLYHGARFSSGCWAEDPDCANRWRGPRIWRSAVVSSTAAPHSHIINFINISYLILPLARESVILPSPMGRG